MKAVLATDLSAASEATIENETCLECLDRIGIDEMHLVTVIPSNVHRGMPGIDFEKRRRKAIRSYEHVIENTGFDVEVHVVRGTPHRRIRGIAETLGASLTVVGSRGKSPLENRVIGSTARNLARTTETPLLVNRIEREAIGEHEVVLVDCYADWCGPCQMFEPTMEALAEETDAAVAKVDVDAHQRLAQQLGARGVPTLVLYADGEPVKRMVGVQDQGTLEGLIEQHMLRCEVI